MKKIFVTGSNGFIGQAVLQDFCLTDNVIAFDKVVSNSQHENVLAITGNITDFRQVQTIFKTHIPDVVIHCAGIAHQGIQDKGVQDLYDAVNHHSTIQLAREAAIVNPDVHFIFLSTVSVYGEDKACWNLKENDPCSPTTDYARTKFSAEQSLSGLFRDGIISRLDILRLAPVYDSTCTLNLEKRVAAPKKIVYLKYGSGQQKMSVLSRQNLVAFIRFRVEQTPSRPFCHTFNVTDRRPCSFNQMRQVLKSAVRTKRRTIKIPLTLVWLGTRIGGVVLKNKSRQIHSYYDKLSKDMVFDNQRMLDSGFSPKHTIETVLKKD